MTDFESKYLDEYKELDKTCSELLGTENGISQYISEMQNTPDEIKKNISSWNSDLKLLKHLRYLRNGLAHDTSPDSPMKEDFYNLSAFKEKLLNSQDSLSQSGRLMARYENEQKFKISKRRKKNKAENITQDEPRYFPQKIYLYLALAMSGIILFIFLYQAIK